MGLVAVAARIGAATVGYEHKVAFHKVDRTFFAVFDVFDLLCRFLLSVYFENYVFNVDTVFDFNSVRFEIFLQRQNQAFILIILRETKRGEIGKPVDMMDVSLKISLHFERRIPSVEGEHRLPIQPEIAVPEIIVEEIAYLLIFESLFGSHEELAYLHSRFFVKPEFAVGASVFAAVYRCSAKRIVGVFFVESVIFVEYGKTGIFERGNVSEHFPHNLEMVVHFSAAAHIITRSGDCSSVARTARYIEFFQKVNMLAFHLTVSHKEERRRKARKPRADYISRFTVYALRFFRTSKCLIVS